VISVWGSRLIQISFTVVVYMVDGDEEEEEEGKRVS